MKQYKAVIVGTGGISKSHVNGIRAQGDRMVLTAACDIDASKVASFTDTHDIPGRYTDFHHMLEKEQPDIVHICTPPMLHAPQSIAAMEAGASVLCEKPLCASLAEFDAIAAAEQTSGQFCSSVFQGRFGSGAIHVKKLIDEQAMGRPLVALCNTVWFRDHDYYAEVWRGKWETELGGPTMGLGIHQMDLLLWLFGEWDEVKAMAATLDRHIEVEDVSTALVRFKNGALATVVNSALSPRQETYIRLDFQKATVELSHLYSYTNDSWTFSAKRGVDEATLAQWARIGDDVPSSHAGQIAAMIQSLDRGERPLVSGEQARRTIEFLTALYKAAITGETVQRGSIVPGDPFYEALNGRMGLPAGHQRHRPTNPA